MSSSSDVDDPLPPDRGLRKVGAVFAAVVLLVVAAAIVIPTVEAGAKAPSGLHTTVHCTTAVVTASAPGGTPVIFTLAPATAADQSVPGAPDAPWRIADGAQRVVTGGT